MQTEIMPPSRNAFDSLGESAQREVEDVRGSIFYRWPTPNVPSEGKLQWDDDLAILWVEFGGATVRESLSWHRQHTERRPSIPAIREQCRQVREKQGRRTQSPGDPRAFEPYGSHEGYDRAWRNHLANPQDDSFLPFELIFRDCTEFQKIRAAARYAGEKIPRSDIREWWLMRTEDTDAEWAQMRRSQQLQKTERSSQIRWDSIELLDILQSIP